MKRLENLVIIVSLLLTGLTAGSQTLPDSIAVEKNLSAKRLAEYRQKFWDSLPEPVSWTNDYFLLFTTGERDYLDSLITDFEKHTSAEIVIVTLDTFCTSIEKMDALTKHIGYTWGIGKNDLNNGMVIGIAPLYRRIRISYGRGIEKYLSGDEIQVIIDNKFIPGFKKGNYFAGTAAGLLAIIELLSGRLTPE